MLRKLKIYRLKRKIRKIELKRERSQAALIEAILSYSTASDCDVEFFNKYTAEIVSLRAKMHQLETR